LLIDRIEHRRRAGQPLGPAVRGALRDLLRTPAVHRAASVALVSAAADLLAPRGTKARRTRRAPAPAPPGPRGPDPELARVAALKRALDS
jgi:hypothetical protein